MRSLVTRLLVEPVHSSPIHDWLSSELEQCGFDGNYTSRCVLNIVDRHSAAAGPRIRSCPTMSLWAAVDEADFASRPSSAAIPDVGRRGGKAWHRLTDEDLKREAVIDLLRLMVSAEEWQILEGAILQLVAELFAKLKEQKIGSTTTDNVEEMVSAADSYVESEPSSHSPQDVAARYYEAFPSLSDKCDLLAGTCSTSPVEPIWAQVAQTRSKSPDNPTSAITAKDDINRPMCDSGRHYRGTAKSGGNRRHRRPRGYCDGRRQKPSRVRSGWYPPAGVERHSWPMGNSLGFPWPCESSVPMYWPLPPCYVDVAWFCQRPAMMFDGSWAESQIESYKDRFSDLASSQWGRPSFGEDTAAETLHCSSLGGSDVSPADCGVTSVLGNNCVSFVNGSDILLDENAPSSPHLRDSRTSENVAGLEQYSHDSNLGKLYSPGELCLSVAQNDRLGVSVDAAVLDDDPLLGCRPLDPELWSVLTSARMHCVGELQRTSSSAVLRRGERVLDAGLQLFGVEPADRCWSDVSAPLSQSACFDSDDDFGSLSLAADIRDDIAAEKSRGDDSVLGDFLTGGDVNRLTWTGMREIVDGWDGPRIVEAVNECDAVVRAVGAKAVREIWQASSFPDNSAIDVSRESSFLGNSNAGDTADHVFEPRYDNDVDMCFFPGNPVQEDKLDGHGEDRYSNWSSQCHCVSCIWQCKLLSCNFDDVCKTVSSSAKPESFEDVGSSESPSPSSSSSRWCAVAQQENRGSRTKSSTWDSQLFSVDCLEPLPANPSTCTAGQNTSVDAWAAGCGRVWSISQSAGDELSSTLSDNFSLCRRVSSSLPDANEMDVANEIDVVTDKVADECTARHRSQSRSSALSFDVFEDTEQMVQLLSGTSDMNVTSCSAEAADIRQIFTSSAAEVEPQTEFHHFIGVEIMEAGQSAASTWGSFSETKVYSTCHPVSSILESLLEDNNNTSAACFADVDILECCSDCDEIVKLLPSTASVSDIIFSDTDSTSISEHTGASSVLSDGSVFGSPEPSGTELVSAVMSPPSLGCLTVLDGAFSRLLHVEIETDLCSAAQCYIGSFPTPVYTIDGSSLWFRDSHYVSANVDALAQLRSRTDLPQLTGWSPAHDVTCSATGQRGCLLPSENTAFCDDIPRRLEAAVSPRSPLLGNRATDDPSRWHWPTAVGENMLRLKPMVSGYQFRPIGTPSTTDSEQSELSSATTGAPSTADSLCDFVVPPITDMVFDSHATYQHFLANRNDADMGNESDDDGRTFRPSFKVQSELEKAAQTGDLSSPDSASSSDAVDSNLGYLVKQVLRQLSTEFPEVSNGVYDVSSDIDDSNGDDCRLQCAGDETSTAMSRRLSVFWNDATAASLESCPPGACSSAVVSCAISQIWTGSAATIADDTSSPSFDMAHSRQLSDIWSDAVTQLGDSAYMSDTADIPPSVLPCVWKDIDPKSSSKTERLLHGMWQSVDSDDPLFVSDVGVFQPQQSIWSCGSPDPVQQDVAPRPCAAENFCAAESHHLVSEAGPSPEPRGIDDRSDQCSVSPSELDMYWNAAESDRNSTTGEEEVVNCDAEHECTLGEKSAFCGIDLLSKDDIWSHSELDGGLDPGTETPWDFKSLASSSLKGFGTSEIGPLHPGPVSQPMWMSGEANLDDVAFAFTHLVSGVLEAMAQSRVAETGSNPAAASLAIDEHMSKSLSALDICCYGSDRAGPLMNPALMYNVASWPVTNINPAAAFTCPPWSMGGAETVGGPMPASVECTDWRQPSASSAASMLSCDVMPSSAAPWSQDTLSSVICALMSPVLSSGASEGISGAATGGTVSFATPL